MEKELDIEIIEQFHDDYISSSENLNLENNIKKFGIKASVIDKKRLDSFKYEFNIEIPEIKMYDQKNSAQCNIYAFLRVIKSLLSATDRNIDFSANYIDFFDKLEKVNTVYSILFSDDDLSFEKINNVINRYIGIYGTFYSCKEIVNKYGLVPAKEMPEAGINYDANELIELLKNKIKKDAIILIDKNVSDKKALKNTLIREAYNFLAKILGNPPINFNYNSKNFTPRTFKNEYIDVDLNNFLTITTFNKNVFLDSNEYIPSVYLNDDEVILKVGIEKLKKAIVAQLNDGIAVWFSAEESTMLDYDVNILDDKLYHYDEKQKIYLHKNKQLSLNMINYDHAMAITGALVKNGEVLQFKVDNSFGYHGKYKGHLIMSNSFLENKVLTCIINKKYLVD